MTRQQRRFPLGDQQGRRKFTNDRSPLQRLELTLDSITKEEKRARVEAAEQAARERAAAAQDRSAPPSAEKSAPAQQVRFSDGAPAAAQRPRAASIGQSTPVTPTAQKGRVSQYPTEDGNRYAPHPSKTSPQSRIPRPTSSHGPVDSKTSPQARAPESRIPRPTSSHDAAGIPQRNLSFRERAAKQDVKLPGGPENESPIAATPTSGFALTRSGSNKLQKNSPKDYWANKRAEAEKYITGSKGQNVAGSPGAGRMPVGTENLGPLQPTSGAPKNRPPIPQGQVGPSPAVARLSKSPSLNKAERLSGDAPSQPQSKADRLLGRTPSQNQSKAERLLGITPEQRAQSAPDQGLGLPATALAAGAAGAAAATAGHHQARRDTRSDSDSDDGHRHVSDLMYHARENLKPGEGIYKPPTYLDEWKSATVGLLSGAMLEFDDAPQNPWERRPSASSRRGSASNRSRNAEAFAGEYDDANGKHLILKLSVYSQPFT